MHFTNKCIALAVAVAVTMVSEVTATPAPVASLVASLVSTDEFLHWLDTTDATITFIGNSIDRNAPRAAENTMVTYCNRRTQDVCGGACTVYNGGAACLAAPGTNCLAATHNVGFCNRGGCGGQCNQLSSCGTKLNNGFCFTPGTNAIIVPPA